MVRVRPQRVAEALFNLSEWRDEVRSQSAPHVLPLLAVLEAGAGRLGATPFRERPDEYAFWDRYLRLDQDERKPYFNPIGLKRAEANFPHSNAATIRKNTFANRWKAGRVDVVDGGEVWTLEPNYAEIFKEKVLTKNDQVKRVPLIDFAVLLFRVEEFPDTATSQDLVDRFRQRFPQTDADYNLIFEVKDEAPDHLFGGEATEDDYRRAIEAELLTDPPAVAPSGDTADVQEAPNEQDPLLIQVQQLLRLGTSGIILRGPPGTGKTYYARKLSAWLVTDPSLDVFAVQFHPSFGYEDFVEGYAPDDAKAAGFSVVGKLFMDACKRADAIKPKLAVVIIDEINRGDPARVFGELLTYLERSYRNVEFRLPFSGVPFSVPENLLLLGTMNPFDRSVSHLDAAFIRRFDHIDVLPSRDVVEAMLGESEGFTEEQIGLIGNWFDDAQRLIPIGLGHSFFKPVRSVDDLKLVWRYRIWPTAETLLELDATRKEGFKSSFDALIQRLDRQTD